MMVLILSAIASVGAGVILAVCVCNLLQYRAPSPDATVDGTPLVSVCIPARNEADNLEPCVRSLLSSDYGHIQVLVYDDESTDGTNLIVHRLCDADPRVLAAPTFPLPRGWNGKQHACAQMGFSARGDWLLFTDADVRFKPDTIRRALAYAQQRDIALASTFPRQVTETLGERLLVPMIHFLLFSYLPFSRMRRTTQPAASAGCGQFLLVRADAYRQTGGHAAFPASMHDGIMLPRLFRANGLTTDLFDGTTLADVRMYHGLIAAWRGFAKNAYEGLGSLGLLCLLTALHLLVYVLPWVWLVWGIVGGRGVVIALAALAIVLAWTERFLLAVRFGQVWWVPLLHPVSVLLMLGIQWHSFVLHLTGRRGWRGRTDPCQLTEDVVLVDDEDRPVGVSEKVLAHRGDGLQHRAFSVLLVDPRGRVLLQKRAASKYHFPGRWANTCCGHPRPGEGTAAAAQRRLLEELGVTADLKPVATFRYTARDANSGLIEREVDHVFTGTFDGEPKLNPLEVSEAAWRTPEDIDHELLTTPSLFAPWFAHVWREARQHVVRGIELGAAVSR